MIYVIVYRKRRPSRSDTLTSFPGYSDLQPVACVRQCVAEEQYKDSPEYVKEVVKPPRR